MPDYGRMKLPELKALIEAGDEGAIQYAKEAGASIKETIDSVMQRDLASFADIERDHRRRQEDLERAIAEEHRLREEQRLATIAREEAQLRELAELRAAVERGEERERAGEAREARGERRERILLWLAGGSFVAALVAIILAA